MTPRLRSSITVLFLIAALTWPGAPALAAAPHQTPSTSGGGISLRGSTNWQPMPVPLLYDPNPIPNRVEPLRPAGLSAQSSTFIIDYVPAGAKNGLGDTCLAYPEAAKAAFNDTGVKWGALLNSAIPIRIEACWASLPQNVLGHSSTLGYYRDFSGAPQAATYFPVALANSLANQDLEPASGCAVASNCDDISIAYANDYLSSFYFGTDGNSQGKTDFESVVMHEMGHGLGFAGSMRATASGSGYTGDHASPAYMYDTFAVNNAGVSLLNASAYPRGGTTLGSVLTSNNVFLNGANGRSANGGNPIPLYTPATWLSGSSYSHLAESYNGTANAMMTFSIGSNEVLHDPGPVVLGVLKDSGWNTPSSPPPAAPAAPAGLTALGTSTSQIYVAWIDQSSNETSFKVMRSMDGTTNWTNLPDVAASAGTGATLGFTDTGLTEGTHYFYSVCAMGASACSSQVTAEGAAMLATPITISAVPIAWNRIDVSWTDKSSHETGYEIQRAGSDGTNWVTIATTASGAGSSTGSRTFQDLSGVTGKVTYRLRAVAPLTTSAWLTGASANPVLPRFKFYTPMVTK